MSETAATTRDYTQLVARTVSRDGAFEAGEGAELKVVNGADEAVVASVPSATPAQVDAVLLAAKAAQRTWWRSGPTARATLMRQMATVLRDNTDALADALTAESGKTRTITAIEVELSAQYLERNAEWGLRIEGEILPSDTPTEQIHIQREPMGVVAAITAWNWPLALLCRKLGPALITGNAVVVKPSEVTPLATIMALQLWYENLDVPAGLLGLVTGDGSVGQALVRNPVTSLVTFTGHRDTGKRIMADASANLTRVALELGGKAPALVLADADLQLAVDGLIAARFSFAGETCGAAERILVERPVYDQFTRLFTEKAAALRVGDPRGDVDFGPLVNRAQLEKVSAAVSAAVAEGATVVTGGSTPTGADYEKGFWFAPTVLTDVSPDMQVAREETFGPVIPIMPVDSLDEALRIANDTRYGLASYVYTSSYASAMTAARELDFGEMFINRGPGEAMHAHHAGWKESGLGGEDGKHGLLHYTQLKVVYHNW
ncbi:lactaldehyde dehydrogenase / glycolaldehyde dehydrogenase [Jatrophihabitans endophyticus]|uniref:Lactaldehyde dehydrogenase / glycolaldehyde dehydrogenase n=1 Tax=Jatrophihabitans endophyticus TaxID=1206085 RepID=A0A1M5PYL8_9ACTN|nr:aldehyde dehydrogenase family protein [Jatrophihabitans endophyticus]SHH07107.1 lactaldehyde dehydrogenase / glycolaldehyde dehydrogenase [Jatrophihabitans endophyticus]